MAFNARKHAIALRRRARELGIENRFVRIDNEWVLARSDGSWEIWSREPSATERRAAEGAVAPRRSSVVEPTVAPQPNSAAAQRVARLFGRNQ